MAPAGQNSAQTCIITPFTTKCKCFYESGTVLYNLQKKKKLNTIKYVGFVLFYSGVVLVLYFDFKFIERIAT